MIKNITPEVLTHAAVLTGNQIQTLLDSKKDLSQDVINVLSNSKLIIDWLLLLHNNKTNATTWWVN